jgi:membrane protein YqaA with SNARE-associated domain
MIAYLSLFGASFVAATLLPFWSELAVAGMVASGYAAWAVLAAATAGNTLGAAVNWTLGRFLLHYREHRWFPIKGERLALAQRWFRRYGSWSLLLSWMPVVGDTLTFLAGVMRVPFWWFLILTATGKGGRYAVLIFAVDRATAAT